MRLRNLRLERRMSLDDLEAASGVSKGHLSGIERGLVVMKVTMLLKIAAALKIDVAELFREK